MKVLIIGSGVAGTACAQAARKLDSNAGITILSEEPHLFYSKSLLAHCFSHGWDMDRLALCGLEGYHRLKLETLTSVRAEEIDPDKRIVRAGNGRVYHYDRLLIASGASPNFPRADIKGLDKKRVFGLRNFGDVIGIRGWLDKLTAKQAEIRAVIIGGGLLGLDAAYHLSKAGLRISLVESQPRLLPTVISEELSRWLDLEERFARHGFEINLEARPLEILGKEGVEAVSILQAGKIAQLPADMVLVAAGVVPNIGLARGCGIKVDKGIITDERQRTSGPDIFAAGDAAQVNDLLAGDSSVFPIWPAAVEQGRVAASNILGGDAKHMGGVSLNSFQFFGLPVCCMGLVELAKAAGGEELVHQSPSPPLYHRLLIEDGYIVGASLAGDISKAGALYTWMRERRPVGDKKEKLLDALRGSS
jgi:nitrite reductase (NADH) large subunit